MKYLLASVCLFMLSCHVLAVERKNDFDLSDSLVAPSEIIRGGPPRDGIPSIDNPEYAPAGNVSFLEDSDLVLGLEHAGIAKAYPTRILVWHEIVNTEFQGEPVVITFCPLCGTGLAFASTLDDQRLEYGHFRSWPRPGARLPTPSRARWWRSTIIRKPKQRLPMAPTGSSFPRCGRIGLPGLGFTRSRMSMKPIRTSGGKTKRVMRNDPYNGLTRA